MDKITIQKGNQIWEIPVENWDDYLLRSKTDFEIYSQRDSRWGGIKLGFGSVTIASHGCFLTCLSMMVKKTPNVVNDILKKADAFGKNNIDGKKDWVIAERAAKALGLEYLGKQDDINFMPNFSPTIKEVEMGRGAQHFVLRIIDRSNPKASVHGTLIVDPWTGNYEKINQYPFKSYRLFKTV